MTTKNKQKKISFGIFAGICEAFVMQPIDTIKVLKQSNQYLGFNNTISKLGPSYLYRGITPFVSQMGVKYALRYTTFELFRGKSNNYYRNFLAGFCAGITESLFITPFEIVKTHQQTIKSKNSVFKTISNLKKEQGLKGLYRGFTTTALRQSINQASNFMVYHEIRKIIIKNDENPPIYKFLLSGFISGSVGPLLNNPFDVIKTRYMNPKFNNSYNSIFHATISIIKNEGIATLYTGLPLRLVRVAGGQGIVFTIIELLNKYFQ